LSEIYLSRGSLSISKNRYEIFLGILFDEISSPFVLFKLVQASFDLGIFPESIKSTRVIILFKGGSRSDTSNYRPISLLPVSS